MRQNASGPAQMITRITTKIRYASINVQTRPESMEGNVSQNAIAEYTNNKLARIYVPQFARTTK